jgi:hypothetical protein
MPAADLLMNDFLIWLETSALSVWVRESPSVFAFPTVLSFHTLGMGIVAGLSAAIDLRILGFAHGVPLALTKRYYPWLWFGFWLNAASGVVLLVGYPTKALTNPVFYGKLVCVALGAIVQMLIRRRVLPDGTSDKQPVPLRGRMLAAASLVLWAAAITSGRFLAYTYHKLTTI